MTNVPILNHLKIAEQQVLFSEGYTLGTLAATGLIMISFSVLRSYFIPPENTKNPMFSAAFRRYKIVILARNKLTENNPIRD